MPFGVIGMAQLALAQALLDEGRSFVALAEGQILLPQFFDTVGIRIAGRRLAQMRPVLFELLVGQRLEAALARRLRVGTQQMPGGTAR